jgi:cation:H+ antiporter
MYVENINLLELVFVIASIVGIWLGSGLIIKNAIRLAKRIHVPPFILSFFLLGFLTSSSEIVIAISSYLKNEPEISAGNLLGGIIILFLFLIPLLAIILKKTQLNHNYSKPLFLINIILLTLPGIFLLDKNFSVEESIILITGCLLIFGIFTLRNISKESKEIFNQKQFKRLEIQLFYIVLGTIILVLSSDCLVKETLKIAHSLNVDPFLISILVLSVGTNLPEISLAIKSVLKGRKDIALGNYMGSALFNVLILGSLGAVNGGINISSDFKWTFIIMTTGLVSFLILMLTKNSLSRKEGFFLLLFYIIFILLETTSIY